MNYLHLDNVIFLLKPREPKQERKQYPRPLTIVTGYKSNGIINAMRCEMTEDGPKTTFHICIGAAGFI